MKKYDVNAPIVFKKGFHDLNDEPHLNYQLNRMINWSGGDLEEVERVSRRIKDFDDWKRTLMVRRPAPGLSPKSASPTPSPITGWPNST